MIVNKETEIIKEVYNIIKNAISKEIKLEVEDTKENSVKFNFYLDDIHNFSMIVDESYIKEFMIYKDNFYKILSSNILGHFNFYIMKLQITNYILKNNLTSKLMKNSIDMNRIIKYDGK